MGLFILSPFEGGGGLSNSEKMMVPVLNKLRPRIQIGKAQDKKQGCALAEPGGPWRLTFLLGRLENLCFFIEIICWAHWISQVQSTGFPSIFLRAQPWEGWRSYSWGSESNPKLPVGKQTILDQSTQNFTVVVD